MVFSLSALLASTLSLPLLFLVVAAASWIIVPAEGWLLFTFGAAMPSIGKLMQLIAVVYAATLLGDLSVYFISRSFSKPVLRFIRKYKFFRRQERATHNLLAKYGLWIVLISRFLVNEVCLVVNYVCGFERFNSKKFITGVIIGEFLYAAGYCITGYLFKDTISYFGSLFKDATWIIVLSALAIYIIYRLIKLIRKKHEGKSKRE
jgi:membrane protein DedA with SNARE-associated domain